jgi:tight adherence protein B
MLQTLFGNFFLVLSVLVFVAVVLLLEGLYVMWSNYKGPSAKKVNQRLQALSAASDTSQQARLLRQRMLSELPMIERILLGLPRAHKLDRFILQASLSWTVSRFLLTSAAMGAAGFLLVSAMLHQSLFMAAVAALPFAAAPLVYVQHRRAKRLATLERQLPDALDLMARALRAGHAFSSSLQMMGEEMVDPVAGEFRFVHDEINYGVSLQQALTNLSARVPLTDVRYFVVSVLIQRDSGGNLTEVLTNLSRLIRERLKLHARVRVLSSEGRLSAWVLGIMPFALAGIMNLVNPAFMTPLWTDPIGLAIVRNMLCMMVIGIIVLRKITRIRV